MIADDLDPAILNRALVLIQIAHNFPTEDVASVVEAWLSTEQNLAEVVLALAQFADPDRHLREGHAAYARGDRNPVVVRLERAYQRTRKARARQYEKDRQAAGEDAA